MIKTREDSTIEVWSDDYINNPDKREIKEDRKTRIIQIERGTSSGFYIVEIVKIPDNDLPYEKED